VCQRASVNRVKIRTSVDLKGGRVEETAVEEGLETGLVERMGGLVDGCGHVRVVEPSEAETGLASEEADLSKSDSHPIESESLDYPNQKVDTGNFQHAQTGRAGGAPGPSQEKKNGSSPERRTHHWIADRVFF
jgi:hypothetical protein